MATYDGDIKLGVSLDDNNVQQSLSKITKTVRTAFSGKDVDELDRHVANTNRTLQQTQKEFQKVQAEIAKTEDKLREYETRYNLIRQRGTNMQSRTNTKEYDGRFYTQRDYEQLTMLDTKLGNIGARLDDLNEKSRNLGASLQSMNTNPQAADNVERTASAANKASRITSGLKSAFSRVTSTAVKFGKKVLGIFGSIGKAVGNTAKTIITKLGSAFTAPIRGIADKITGLFKKISVAMRRVFFLSVLTGAFRNVRSSISNLLKSNDSLNSSLKQIKSNLITAFAPVYNKALPAINALAKAVAKATGYIAAFFSALTGNSIGQSFSQAQDVYSQARDNDDSTEADQIDAEIDAIEDKIKAIEKEKKAYEKAKEAEERANKKSLLSFDELNQLSPPEQEDETLAAYEAQIEALEEQLDLLQDQKDALKDIGDAAEELEYPTYADAAFDKMASLVDMLKEAWSDGDFTDIGKKLKDAIVTQLNKIKWNDIKANANKLGKSLATFLNGILTEDFGDKIGETLGEAINTAVNGVAGFVNNIDAAQIGRSLSAFIVRGVNTIDWNLVKETATNAGIKIADFFNNAINPESFGAIGTAIGNGIQTAINFASGFIQTIDPINIGESLAAMLNNAVDSIDWKQLGQTIFQAFHKAVQSLIAFMRTTDWEDVGRAIADVLSGIPWGTVLYDVAVLIWEALKAAFFTVVGIFKESPETGLEILGALGLFTALKLLTGLIKDNLLSAFKKKDSALDKQTKKTQTETQAVNAFATEMSFATNNANALSPALDGITRAGVGLIPVVDSLISGHESENLQMQTNSDTATQLSKSLDTVTSSSDATSTATETLGNVAEQTNEKLGVITGGAENVSTAMDNASTNTKSAMTSFAENVANAMKNGMENITNMVKNSAGNVYNWADNIGTNTGKVAENTSQNIHDMLYNTDHNISVWATSTSGTIARWGSNVSSNIAQAAKSAVQSVGTAMSAMSQMQSASTSGGLDFTPVGRVPNIPSWLPQPINLSGMNGSSAGLLGTIGAAALSLAPLAIAFLAKGGVIPPNREFLAVLGDQKHGTNIEAPLDTIKQAVAEVTETIYNRMDTLLRKQTSVLEAIKTTVTAGFLKIRELNNDQAVMISSSVTDITDTMGDYINGYIRQIVDMLIVGLQPIFGNIDLIREDINTFINGGVKEFMNEFARSAFEANYGGLVDEITNAFSASFTVLAQSIEDKLFSVIGYLGQIHTQLEILLGRQDGGTKELLENIIDRLHNIYSLIWDFMSLFQRIFAPKDKDKDEDNKKNTSKLDIEELQRMVYDKTLVVYDKMLGGLLVVNWDYLYKAIEQTRDVVFGDVKGLQSNLSKILNGINSSLQSSINGAAQTISSGIAYTNGILNTIASQIGGLSSTSGMPHLATGAVIPPNREFMAVLGDQTSGTNVEAPLSTIKQAVSEAMGEGSNNATSGMIDVTLQIDKERIARILVPALSKENSRLGTSIMKGTTIYE